MLTPEQIAGIKMEARAIAKELSLMTDTMTATEALPDGFVRRAGLLDERFNRLMRLVRSEGEQALPPALFDLLDPAVAASGSLVAQRLKWSVPGLV